MKYLNPLHSQVDIPIASYIKYTRDAEQGIRCWHQFNPSFYSIPLYFPCCVFSLIEDWL